MHILNKIKITIKNILRSLMFCIEHADGAVKCLFALSLAAALLGPCAALISKTIIDRLVALNSPITTRSESSIFNLLLVDFIIITTIIVLEKYSHNIGQKTGMLVAAGVRQSILEKTCASPVENYDDPRFLNLLYNARKESSFRPASFVVQIVSLFKSVIVFVSFGYVLVSEHYWMLFGLLVSMIPIVLSEFFFSERIHAMRNANSEAIRKINYVESLFNGDRFTHELKFFNVGHLLVPKFRSLLLSYNLREISLSGKRTLISSTLLVISWTACYACYAVLIWMAVQMKASVGQTVLCMIAFRQIQWASQAAAVSISTIYDDSLYMSNFFSFINFRTGKEFVVPGSAKADAKHYGLRIDNVSFSYANSGKSAVENISFESNRGSVIAIMGKNGSGKSTLAKIICGIICPQKGRVLLDGRPISDESKENFSLFFQDHARYELSLRDNISLGRVSLPPGDEEIISTLKNWGGGELFSLFRNNLDVYLGRRFSDGIELSGGQWQKIALCRALIRNRAKVLVLDEPTSALDPFAETDFFENLKIFGNDKITLIITHNINVSKKADRVLVIDSGMLIEDGTHEKLMSNKHIYYEMACRQNAN